MSLSRPSSAKAPPVRRWYYLGGYFDDGNGGKTTDPCSPLRFPPGAWEQYSPEVSFQLSESYQDLVRNKGKAGEGKLLDLAAFSDPPLEYEIWKGRESVVRNPAAPANLRGKSTVGGFPVPFWTEVANNAKLLPPNIAQWVDMGVGNVVGGFYQIHHSSVGPIEEVMRFLEDPSGRASMPQTPPRKRIVMLIEFPAGWHEVRQREEPPPPVHEEGPVVMEDGAPPVYEWWYGDRPPQAELNGTKPLGFWRPYHPRVCRMLENVWLHNDAFQKNSQPTDVDGVRYMVQRISADSPFDYTNRSQGDPFTEDLAITIDHPCYEPLDRIMGNCLVQFHKDNHSRRRPARRSTDAEDIARNAARTGEPCSVCFSEEGELTGCPKMHVICGLCLRAGLRSMAGDITVCEHLVCGCFDHRHHGALVVLAERADTAMQACLSGTPANDMERMERDMELADSRRQFDLGADGCIPPTLYQTKVNEWFEKVIRQRIAPDYHVCKHPDCAVLVNNWMLRTDFDTEYRAKGKTEWTCPAGHRNTVLPSEEEIREMNKNLLLHPEYYIESAPFSSIPLRRYRVCKECVAVGVLMLGVHGGECKQWPGYGRGHHHCFCFACTRKWGSECDHGNRSCADPGIQQIRRIEDRLDIGYVDGPAYLSWLKGEQSQPPPTMFSNEPCTVQGASRQRALGMENKKELLAESRKGTN